jgi:selenide,water dikinase
LSILFRTFGLIAHKHLKENSTAKVGDKIYLTKPLGIGILTTAQKQKKITPEDEKRAICTSSLIALRW